MDRPFVTLCMAMSLDGRVNTPGKPWPEFTSRRDRELLFRLRAESDLLLIGAGTVRQEGLQPLVRDPDRALKRKVRRGKSHPDVALFSQSGHLDVDSSYFGSEQEFHVFSCAQEPAVLPRHIHWYRRENLDIATILDELGAMGFHNMLLEGGPTLAASFFDVDRVDAIRLTLAPSILGGLDRSGLVQGVVHAQRAFELVEVEPHQSEVYLHYRR